VQLQNLRLRIHLTPQPFGDEIDDALHRPPRRCHQIVGRNKRSVVPAIRTLDNTSSAGTALRLFRPTEKLTASECEFQAVVRISDNRLFSALSEFIVGRASRQT